MRAARRRTGSQAWVIAYGTLLLLLALRLASDTTAIAAYLGLAIYAGFGRVYAIRALTLSWFFTMINPGLAPEGSSAAAGRFIVILGAAASIFMRGIVLAPRPRLSPFIVYTLILGITLVIHSIFISPLPDVSILKAVIWTIVVITLLPCWLGMSPTERFGAARELFWGLLAIMLVSLPLLFHPTGYLRNGWGFQGVLNHPQAFGPVMALLGAWAGARILAEPKPSWLMIALVGACFILVFLSGARTAGLGLIGGIGLAVLLAPWLSGQQVRVLFPGLRSPRIWFLCIFLFLLLLVMAPFLSTYVTMFLSKNSDSDSLLDAYGNSRGALIDAMMSNILYNVFSGIGFGISSDYTQMIVERDPLFDLPLSAPIEKGVLIFSIVEELGILVGSMVFLWFSIILKVASKGGIPIFSVCLSIFLFNFGEATLFSPGGMGVLWLIFLSLGYASGRGLFRNG